MGPARKELIEHIVALIVATQDLARATEESTREYRALREDVARLGRRSRARRHPRLGREDEPGTRGRVIAIHSQQDSRSVPE